MLDYSDILFVRAMIKSGGELTPEQKAVLSKLDIVDGELQSAAPFYAPEISAEPNTFYAGTQVGIKDIGSSLGYSLARYPGKLRTLPYVEFDKAGTTKRPHDIDFDSEVEFTSYDGQTAWNNDSVFEFPVPIEFSAVANGIFFSFKEFRNNNTRITILSNDTIIREIEIPYDYPHTEYFCEFPPFALYANEPAIIRVENCELGSMQGSVVDGEFRPYLKWKLQRFTLKDLATKEYVELGRGIFSDNVRIADGRNASYTIVKNSMFNKDKEVFSIPAVSRFTRDGFGETSFITNGNCMQDYHIFGDETATNEATDFYVPCDGVEYPDMLLHGICLKAAYSINHDCTVEICTCKFDEETGQETLDLVLKEITLPHEKWLHTGEYTWFEFDNPMLLPKFTGYCMRFTGVPIHTIYGKQQPSGFFPDCKMLIQALVVDEIAGRNWVLSEIGKIQPSADNPYKGKIAVFLGDSQTEVNSHKTKTYCEWVKEKLQLLSINNYGLSGSTIAKKNSSDADAFCERYKNMTSNADIIFVMGGVNDVWFSSELGKITDTSDLTFYGAMNTLCNGLYSKYPGKQIVFITPTEEDNSSCVSSKGYVVSDFANAMRAVCSKYSIPVFDANACVGIYPYNQINSDLYTTDKLHLNDEGHKAIGDKLSRFVLNGCISNSCVIVNSGDVPQPTDPWIGKTFSATGKRYDDFYHLTLLLDADSDCFNGSKVTGHLKGSDLVNVVAGSMSGGSIFGDNSGDLTNSQYTKTYCGNVAFETVVSGGKMTINFPERVFNTNWGGESYVKIPIMIGLSTLPCSFKIDELEVYINGNKKDIIKIGGFFTDETYSIT